MTATMVANGRRYVAGCDKCKGAGCYWCYADHDPNCVTATGGTNDDGIVMGNCQSVPCEFETPDNPDDESTRMCPELFDTYPHSQWWSEPESDDDPGHWYCPTCLTLEAGECPRCGDNMGGEDVCAECGWPHHDESDDEYDGGGYADRQEPERTMDFPDTMVAGANRDAAMSERHPDPVMRLALYAVEVTGHAPDPAEPGAFAVRIPWTLVWSIRTAAASAGVDLKGEG